METNLLLLTLLGIVLIIYIVLSEWRQFRFTQEMRRIDRNFGVISKLLQSQGHSVVAGTREEIAKAMVEAIAKQSKGGK
jgi:hypothetical protein